MTKRESCDASSDGNNCNGFSAGSTNRGASFRVSRFRNHPRSWSVSRQAENSTYSGDLDRAGFLRVLCTSTTPRRISGRRSGLWHCRRTMWRLRNSTANSMHSAASYRPTPAHRRGCRSITLGSTTPFGRQQGEGFEFHLLVIAMSAALVTIGGGKWAVDGVIARRLEQGERVPQQAERKAA